MQETTTYEIIRLPEDMDVYFTPISYTNSFVSAHWHYAIELIYIRRGCIDLKVGRKVLHMPEDSLALVNSKDIHSLTCSTENESLLLQIPDTFISRYIPEWNALRFEIPHGSLSDIEQTKLQRIKETLQQMYIIYDIAPEGGNLRFASLTFELLFQLYHSFRTASPIPPKQQIASLNRLDAVLRYMNEHYTEPITLQALADAAGLQPEYFCRFFKKTMGLTCFQYLSEIRLSHIYQDLKHTDTPLYQLLEQHGFTNYKLFRKVFYQKFGTTPSKVRREAN